MATGGLAGMRAVHARPSSRPPCHQQRQQRLSSPARSQRPWLLLAVALGMMGCMHGCAGADSGPLGMSERPGDVHAIVLTDCGKYQVSGCGSRPF